MALAGLCRGGDGGNGPGPWLIAELTIGLVELGVGLIAGGRCKDLLGLSSNPVIATP